MKWDTVQFIIGGSERDTGKVMVIVMMTVMMVVMVMVMVMVSEQLSNGTGPSSSMMGLKRTQAK